MHKLVKFSFFLLGMFLCASPVKGAECEAYFVTEQYKSDQSIIKFWHFQDEQWGESTEVNRSDEKWNFSPTMSFNQSGEIVFVWMAADKNEFQIYSRVLSAESTWKTPAIKMTNSLGQKSAPRLFLTLDKKLYTAWLSDESGNDEIQLSVIENNLETTKIENLFEKNDVPDIDPNFEYQLNASNKVDLIFNWRQLSKKQFSYIDQNVTLQTDVVDPIVLKRANDCDELFSKIDKPDNVTKGTFYFPSRLTQPYSYFK